VERSEHVFQPGGIRKEDQRTQKDRRSDTGSAVSEELNISTDQLRKMECGSRGPSLDLLISLAVYFDVSTDYLLMGRDYVNLHSRKRLEGVLQELSGIIADLQDV
jgi:transcriptional regulator with XRE-family HTH domain